MEVAGLPSLSLDERIILRTSERKDMFDEKFPDGDPSRAPPSPNPAARTSQPPAESSASEVLETTSDDHRSASSGSISSLASKRDDDNQSSTEDFGHFRSRSRANTFSSSIEESGRGYAGPGPGPDHKGERASTPVFSSGRPKDTHLFETSIVVHGKKMPMQIPLGTFPEEIGDVSLFKH